MTVFTACWLNPYPTHQGCHELTKANPSDLSLVVRQAPVKSHPSLVYTNMAVCQNLVPLVNIKIAGKWMFIPLKMVCIGIDP